MSDKIVTHPNSSYSVHELIQWLVNNQEHIKHFTVTLVYNDDRAEFLYTPCQERDLTYAGVFTYWQVQEIISGKVDD